MKFIGHKFVFVVTVAFLALAGKGVGAVGGGLIALHGTDVAVSGFRKLWSGESTRCNDSLTSQGLQAAGMRRDWANLADAGISTVGSLGIGAAARAANAVRQTRQAIANDIANGHAFTKHGAEMGFSSPEQMASHIDAVLKNPSAVRQLSRGSTAYWHNPSQSVVIHNPSATTAERFSSPAMATTTSSTR